MSRTDIIRPATNSSPAWVAGRAANLSSLTNSFAASADSSSGQSSNRVFNFHRMTPASAARKVERIDVGRELVTSATKIAETSTVHAAPISNIQLINGPSQPGVTTPPTPPSQPGVTTPRTQPGVTTPRTQPGVTTPPTQPGVTTPPTQPGVTTPPTQPGVTTPPTQPGVTTPRTQPGVTTPSNPNQNQQPGAGNQQPSQPEAAPDPDIFGLPDTKGRKPGDEWDTTLPDGRIVHNRIPFGNGNQTVDQTIPDGKGGFTTSRVAGNGQGGWQRWNLNADGTAFYGGKYTAESDMYGQDYNSGTSTSGRPDRAYVSTPDYKGIKNPSYDKDGNLVGIDVAVPNQYGMFDNYHYDNYGNLTISTAKSDGKGGVESTLIGQFDTNGEGWQLGPDGKPWNVGKDLQGRITMGRTEQTKEGTHVYFIDHRGVMFDSFYGTGSNKSYTDIYNEVDKTINRKFRDGASAVYDATGKPISFELPPDRRDFIEKGWDWTAGVGNSLKTWGSDLVSNFNFAPGLQAAANPLNPAYQAAAATHYERSMNAAAAPGRLLWDGVVASGTTLADWYRYKVGGAFYGLGGDPYTPSGRARLQAAQAQMDKAPADWEAALAATMFLPIGGTPVRAGTAALRSGEVAIAEAAAAAAARQVSPSIVGRALPNLSVYNPLRNVPDFAKNSFDSIRNLPSFATNGLRSMPGVTGAGDALRNIPANLVTSIERFRTVPERFQVWRDVKIEGLIESMARLETTARAGVHNTRSGLQDLLTVLGARVEPQLATGARGLPELDNLLADALRARFAATHGPGGGFLPRFSGPVSMPNNAFGPVRPRATQKHTVDFNRGKTDNTRHKVGETARQIDGQIAGVNKMTANELLHNMKTVSRKGKAQKAANKEYKAAILAQEEKNALRLLYEDPAALGGMKPERYAKERMKERTKDLAALHEQDIVAGGLDVIGLDAKGLPKMGDTFVNSSLGSQWAHRGLADDLRRYAEDLVRSGQGDYLLNVEWILR
ncbi:polymorphic toxin type 15 domain-containing protein [Nocardia sp. XZ_19_369]|uniref:polymorphic toxin type 15 domain-containing protein n=1 Tax=Nocardia sp. XZ_19_369 TaxID=2769487 RepID=UPI00188F5712|nr:polymorphic toxin type 15 domain-containing protein [Nocardia sp. XZ_19_369]